MASLKQIQLKRKFKFKFKKCFIALQMISHRMQVDGEYLYVAKWSGEEILKIKPGSSDPPQLIGWRDFYRIQQFIIYNSTYSDKFGILELF